METIRVRVRGMTNSGRESPTDTSSKRRVVVAGGQVQGVVPKSYLPNYGEFYEARQFSAADNASTDRVTLLGSEVPFGSALLFEIANMPLFRFHVEIGHSLTGLIVRYQGWLAPDRKSASPRGHLDAEIKHEPSS